MANKKKGQTVKTPSYCAWWKHLRKEGKRFFWKSQRSADKRECRKNNPG